MTDFMHWNSTLINLEPVLVAKKRVSGGMNHIQHGRHLNCIVINSFSGWLSLNLYLLLYNRQSAIESAS